MPNRNISFLIILVIVFFTYKYLAAMVEGLHDSGFLFIGSLLVLLVMLLTIIYFKSSFAVKSIVGLMIGTFSAFITVNVLFMIGLYTNNGEIARILGLTVFYLFTIFGWKLSFKRLKA